MKDARRNSEQIRRSQTFWGPLFDHFPGFKNFVKICQNGFIPQTVQIWPSGQASGLDPQDPRGARFDSWCVFKAKCFWGGAKAFSAAKINLPKINIKYVENYLLNLGFIVGFEDFAF